MNLGDVVGKNVPKMCLLSPPKRGGAINTRSFIPHRVHSSIGVLGAISVATACALPGSVASGVSAAGGRIGQFALDIEHPTGFFTVDLEVTGQAPFRVTRSALLRTARMLMRGEVLVPSTIWSGARETVVALIGYGEVGRIFARDLSAGGFDAILAYDILFDAHDPACAPPARAVSSTRDAVSDAEARRQRRHGRPRDRRRGIGRGAYRPQNVLLRCEFGVAWHEAQGFRTDRGSRAAAMSRWR